MICSLPHFTIYPAINAAITAPKKPAFVLLANAPPIKPAPIAGLSAIEKAMKPANTVLTKPIPVQPTCSNKYKMCKNPSFVA